MGSGKTMVEFFSADIVFKVCKWKLNTINQEFLRARRSGLLPVGSEAVVQLGSLQ